jgi:hypothetical protein
MTSSDHFPSREHCVSPTMASSENDDLALAVLRVRVRNHLDVLRGSLNEYFDVAAANEEARLESEQELAKVRDAFEKSVRGSKAKPPIPERSALRDELWSEFDVDAIRQPALAESSNATGTLRIKFTPKEGSVSTRKERWSQSEVIADKMEERARIAETSNDTGSSGSQKIRLKPREGDVGARKVEWSKNEIDTDKMEQRRRLASFPTPHAQENQSPRESAGLNFTPRSQSMSAKIHLNLQKVRVPRSIRLRLSRIFNHKPKSTPASPVINTVVAEPADVGNLLSRPNNPI